MKKQTKTERTERRRQVGARILAQRQRVLVSWHPPYSEAHACFWCRTSFKRDPNRAHICPACSRTVYAMGRAFRAPKRDDIEQWTKVQRLYAYGFRFHRYGGDYPPLPEHAREVDDFVAAHPRHPLRVGVLDVTLLQPTPNRELK